jgi:vanillate/3-O-methylgallate O-demethylase
MTTAPDWIVNPLGLTPTDSLQDGLDRAGGAINLLWKPNAPNVTVPVVPPEFVGWREEQRSWIEGVSLFDLSHHMADLYVEGPDAVKLLSYVSANNYENFEIGQAKQFVTVTPEGGHLIQDGILERLGEQRFNLIGIGAAHNWVAYHAKAGGYDVNLTFDPPSDIRPGDPISFRYQVQGPKAPELMNTLFGDALDGLRFFHFREVDLSGQKFHALRHGMAGEAGVELFGSWEHAGLVKEALLSAGGPLGLVQTGGLAYYTSGEFSAWLATPVAGIYTEDSLLDYRRATSVFGYEGLFALQGSFYSPNIEDYYVSPYELGYGRSIAYNHDFIGRAALERARDQVSRTKVTLVWDKGDVARVFGIDSYLLSYTKDRVEFGSELVGRSEYASYFSTYGTVHSIALVDTRYATPGTEVTVRWGQHPGPDCEPDDVPEFEAIRAVVQHAPYHEYARTAYRAD